MTLGFNRTFLLFAFFIAACSTLQKLKPLETDLPAAQEKMPGITLSDLQSGYKLYLKKCSGCHSLHYPNEYYEKQWDIILPKMYLKAKITSETEKLKIKQFLFSKAR